MKTFIVPSFLYYSMAQQEEVLDLWLQIAALELGKRSISSKKFKLIFGFSELTVHVIHQLYFLNSPFAKPKLILWLLSFLKNYERDGIAHLKFVKSNERTFRDTIWRILDFLVENVDETEVDFCFMKELRRFHNKFFFICAKTHTIKKL
jgi:hypothetical protein